MNSFNDTKLLNSPENLGLRGIKKLIQKHFCSSEPILLCGIRKKLSFGDLVSFVELVLLFLKRKLQLIVKKIVSLVHNDFDIQGFMVCAN